MRWLLVICPWIIFVPLFLLIRNKKPLTSFLYSYIYGLVYFGFLVYWVGFVTSIGMTALVLYLGLYIGAFGWVAQWRLNIRNKFDPAAWPGCKFLSKLNIISNLLPDMVFLSCVWVILEFIRRHFFIAGFGWALLGHSQTPFLPLIQIARFTGDYGVSFMVMAVNIVVFKFIRYFFCHRFFSDRVKYKSFSGQDHKDNYKVNLYLETGVTFLIVSACTIYGFSVLNRDTINDTAVRVGIIQGNIPQEVKWDERSQGLIMERYSLLSRLAADSGAEIIIWPETSVPDYMKQGKKVYEKLSALALDTKTEFLVGAPYRKDGEIFNSVFLFSGRGRLTARYDKLRLVPFGEYMPFADQLKFLEKHINVINEVGDFSAGGEYTLFPIPRNKSLPEVRGGGLLKEKSIVSEKERGSLAVLICFEDTFNDLVRDFVNKGAGLLVNITNDAWFGRSRAPYQHMNSSVFRAVENHRSMVRCANTGVSCFIDPHGRIYSKVSAPKAGNDDNKEDEVTDNMPDVDIFVSGYRVDDVVISTERTFYSRYGDVFIYVCIFVVLLGSAGVLISKKAKNNY